MLMLQVSNRREWLINLFDDAFDVSGLRTAMSMFDDLFNIR